jgi:twinkle protein
MEHDINPNVVQWFATRGISNQTLKATGVYSGQHRQSGDSFEIVPGPTGEIVVFPYLRHGTEVNAKYRARGKKFYQKPNGQKTFFNADVLDEPCLKDGSVSLIITEGEMDALAVIECGYPYVVSVPDGAPPHIVGISTDEDIDAEYDGKYVYIFNNWDALKPIRKIIIATDADDPGKRLAEELVRRLGRVRCQFIEYPKDCKDLNDVLLEYGPSIVTRTLIDAKPYPVSGLYTFSELPQEPEFESLTTGWDRLDPYIRPFYPAFMVVTGVAGSGKSTWVNQLVAQMSIIHGIGIGIASFEMRINPFVSQVLLNTYNDLRGGSEAERNRWLDERFVFISPEPGDDNNEFNVDWLIDKATAAVIRYGIRILVVDPWNEIEHAVRRLENFSDYTGRAIRALKRFGREFDVLVIIVAHPTKSGAQKQPKDITLYDISDSAHFANKADFGVVIYPVEGTSPGYEQSCIMVKKVRYRPMTGNLGEVFFSYDMTTRTFER